MPTGIKQCLWSNKASCVSDSCCHHTRTDSTERISTPRTRNPRDRSPCAPKRCSVPSIRATQQSATAASRGVNSSRYFIQQLCPDFSFSGSFQPSSCSTTTAVALHLVRYHTQPIYSKHAAAYKYFCAPLVTKRPLSTRCSNYKVLLCHNKTLTCRAESPCGNPTAE